MARGQKTGGREFKPGQSGNPNGRPRIPAHIREAKTMNKIQFTELLTKYLLLTQEELRERFNDPESTAIELLVMRVLIEAIKHGDERRLSIILDRAIGKVGNSIEVSNPDGSMKGSVVFLPANGREAKE